MIFAQALNIKRVKYRKHSTIVSIDRFYHAKGGPFLVRLQWPGIAICTILALTFLAASAVEAEAGVSANRDLYRSEQVINGAGKIPVLAQMSYRNALAALENGEKEQAQKHLHLALRYDPDYTDAYFTLARIKATQLKPDAPVYFIQAIQIDISSFAISGRKGYYSLFIMSDILLNSLIDFI